MRPSLALACLALALAGCARSVGSDPRALPGTWQGTLTTPSGGLRVVVQIEDRGGALSAVMRSPDQGGGDIALEMTRSDAGHLAFHAPSLDGSFDGAWSDSLRAWGGTWSQSGYELPLVLRRASARATIDGLDGTWEGAVEREGKRLRLVLHVTTDADGTTARFDAPDAGASGLEVRDLARDKDRVRFIVAVTRAEFDGHLSEEGDVLTGEWRFPGRPVTEVTLRRADREQGAMRGDAGDASARTSIDAPAPYRSLEVRIENPRSAGVALAGTLTLPDGRGPFPAAVLVSGSGAEDRDESLFGHRPFAVLADYLSRRGIAVLRTDDRGVGGSSGVYSQATPRDLAGDIGAAVAFLEERDDIDPRAVGVIGHSEGGLDAAIAASEDAAIDFVVLLAAPGVPMRRVLLDQHRALGASLGVDTAQLDRAEPVLASVFDAIAGASTDDEAATRMRALLTPSAREALGIEGDSGELFVQQMARSGIRHSLLLDPAEFVAQVRVPVLAIGGSLDLQVDAARNLAALRAALAGNRDATVLELPGINYMLQTARTGALAEYAEIAEAVAPVMMETVAAWIEGRFGARARG